ncbi:TPA: amino acid racemase, partial [Clostridioides difficile]|nr:amino acid racemase [Clostridioides difficile]
LLGTKYTMEQDFYKNIIINNGIDVLIPDEEDRIIVNNTIFNELCVGIVSESSKKAFISIIDKLGKQGAEGVVLGCTETGLLIKQNDTSIPLFDTTIIHAIEAALSSI